MNNPMMNNPVIQMMQYAKQGGSPIQFLQNMAGNNPQAKMVMQMMNGKNPQQLRNMAENIAKERGTSIEQIAQSLGMQIPNR